MNYTTTEMESFIKEVCAHLDVAPTPELKLVWLAGEVAKLRKDQQQLRRDIAGFQRVVGLRQ